MNIKTFIERFSKEIEEGNAAIFAGAGLSVPAGYVNWSKLLKPLADEIRLDITKEHDLVSLAQYHCNSCFGNRNEVNRVIVEEFSRNVQITENHKILSRLPISTFWTTNYDSLIEDALEDVEKIADVKHTIDQMTITVPKRDAVVYKMHGDKRHPNNAIILKEDYEWYSSKYGQFITALSGDLVSKTFLFIGFSFTDPNLDYILSRIRIGNEKNLKRHYAFIRKINRNDYGAKESPKLDADFEYDKRKQELFIADLIRYGISPVMIDEYSQITDILSEIEKSLNQRNIFISGSADEYGSMETDTAREFIEKMSKRLIREDYNLISGFGIGVGSFVITGALNEIYMKQKRINHNQLLLRPFPQGILDDLTREKLWNQYREDMISRAGISIFIFGNKKNKDEIVQADGVYSEFEIAKLYNNIIIPMGATGYVAKSIWDEVKLQFDKFYPKNSQKLKELFQKLNDDQSNLYELIENIVEFIKEIKICNNL